MANWASSAAFGVGLALPILLAALHLGVSDRMAWGEWLTIWPPVLWLFPLIPLALLSLDRRRLWKAGSVCLASVLFVGIAGEWRSLLPRGQATQLPGMAIRVVSWNIDDASGGRQRVLDTLSALDPDLCFLQETPDGHGSFASGELTGALAGHSWHDAGDCGLLSRWPIANLPSERVGPWTPPQLALVEPAGESPLLLVNVRLMLPSLVVCPITADSRRRLSAMHSARVEQFRRLATLIVQASAEAGAAGVILAGDFNAPGRMWSLSPVRHNLQDVWPIAGRGWPGTIISSFPVERIDLCFVSSNIRPVNARVEPTVVSDHRLLVADLVLSPTPR